MRVNGYKKEKPKLQTINSINNYFVRRIKVVKDKNQKREVNRKLEAWYNAYVVDDIDLNKEIASIICDTCCRMYGLCVMQSYCQCTYRYETLG